MYITRQDYDELLPLYESVEKAAYTDLAAQIAENGIIFNQITYRIKSFDSVREKLERKRTKYSQISELTDVVGLRVVCFFSADIDRAAEAVGRIFDVDMDRSVDKRENIAPTAFGYVSLHFICSLRPENGYSEEMCAVKFEVQMRSILQHAWAEIEHDLGYKTDFGIPKTVRREFARVAGLLELADEKFDSIRTDLLTYEKRVLESIDSESGEDFPIDLVTVRAFISLCPQYLRLCGRIAEASGAKLVQADPENYLKQLSALGITTTNGLIETVREHEGTALAIATSSLAGGEIDELASTVGLYYLIRAKLIDDNADRDRIADVFMSSGCRMERAYRNADRLLRRRNILDRDSTADVPLSDDDDFDV